ncbi:hypothetical protein [Endozoicomonas sp. SESOKO1]|uniref:hypothetical protein n=1 Tax=Endozoicomonas sp. SESOKO1 TaxID=2828742 RepID=UPI00214821E0|nr:hypothetical protein [Endozoicomonas sp. SESOKO1]
MTNLKVVITFKGETKSFESFTEFCGEYIKPQETLLPLSYDEMKELWDKAVYCGGLPVHMNGVKAELK